MQKIALTSLAFLLMLATGRLSPVMGEDHPAGTQSAPWSGFRGDARNTGRGQWRAPASMSAWTFETLPSANGGNRVFASPVLSRDGAVYIGGSRLHALDAVTGRKKWQFYAAEYPFQGSSALSADGWIYTGCENGFLYALDAQTGKVRWQHKSGGPIRCSPSLSADSVLYVGSADNALYALDARTGQQRWTFTAQHDVMSSPVIGAHDLIYCQNWGMLYAIQRRDGKPLWTYKAAEDLYSKGNPAIGADGTLYAAFVLKGPVKGGLASVVALDGATGKPLWTVALPKYVYASPALGNAGLVYIGCGDGKLYALEEKTGKTRWTFEAGIHIQASPAIGVDGTVYVGSYDQKLYAIDGKTGAKKWEVATGGSIESSPAVSLDGTVFVGSFDGKVYAIRPNGKSAPSSVVETK